MLISYHPWRIKLQMIVYQAKMTLTRILGGFRSYQKENSVHYDKNNHVVLT